MIKFVIVVFTLFCPVAFSVKHSFKMFLTATSGVPDFPEFVGSLLVDEVQAAYCDSIVGRTEPKVNWAREFLEENAQHLDYYIHECKTQSQFLRDMIDGLMKSSDNIRGAHILQQIHGCEWDDETLEVRGFNQFGYNGEDFIELDLQTRTWKASKQQASIFKQRWDTNKTMLDNNIYYHLHLFPDWLKKYIHYAESSLQRTDLPAVSLFQKTSSSPVTCHATGFYPNRVELFWRKDGEKLHEDVDKGEILPNHDGTFQMSVDLYVSSIAPEDWEKYDCVFQMSGVKDDVITKLDKSVIRSNSGFAISGVVVGLLLLLLCIAGLFIWRKKTNGFRPANTSDSADTHSDPNSSQLSGKTGGGE